MTDKPKYFCADCLRYQETMKRPCPDCGSIRVVLLSVVDQIVGDEDRAKTLADIEAANPDWGKDVLVPDHHVLRTRPGVEGAEVKIYAGDQDPVLGLLKHAEEALIDTGSAYPRYESPIGALRSALGFIVKAMRMMRQDDRQRR